MTLREICEERKHTRLFVGANTSFFMIGTGEFILSLPEMQPYMEKGVESVYQRTDGTGLNVIIDMDGSAKFWDLAEWEKEFNGKPEKFQKYLDELPEIFKPITKRKRTKR